MVTPTFPKIIFFHEIKASLDDRVGTHVRNAGPHLVPLNSLPSFAECQRCSTCQSSGQRHFAWEFDSNQKQKIMWMASQQNLVLQMQCLFEYSGVATVGVFETYQKPMGQGVVTLSCALGVAYCEMLDLRDFRYCQQSWMTDY